ncbi:MAG: Ig-like domain-containing protein [Bacilli bacterium]|nr:Ig-like domain-containing protein [Bacilli bacterium]
MKKFTLGLLAVSFLSLGAVVACDGGHGSSVVAYDFSVSLSNGSTVMNKGEEAHVNIDEIGGNPEDVREFTYTSLTPSVAAVNANGTVTALAKGETIITVSESKSEKTHSLKVTVIDASPADGGFNYASASGKSAIEKRTEILGALEKNAMDNHLTGITLF